MPVIPVRLPAKVNRPPGADSWLAVSAVMVSAAVAPRPDPGQHQGGAGQGGTWPRSGQAGGGLMLPVPVGGRRRAAESHR